MKVVTISAYETSDGRQFLDMVEALKAERTLRLRALFESHGWNGMSTRDAADIAAEHFGTFIDWKTGTPRESGMYLVAGADMRAEAVCPYIEGSEWPYKVWAAI